MKRFLLLIILGIILMLNTAAYCDVSPADALKARIEESTKKLTDISFVVTVVEKNKDALSKMDSNYTTVYEFKNASISMRLPDKMRIEGKLGMVKFEYIINGFVKVFRASAVRINKRSDYSHNPAKLQDALDMGLVTSSIWRGRTVSVVDDPPAANSGQIKLKLQWPNSEPYSFIWLDAKNLFITRLEKYDGDGKLVMSINYTNHQNIGGIIWMPTRMEMRNPSGELVGAIEMSNIKYNTGLPDSLFE
ncbi:MAG: outer membrane lipoprotein-sorting protein [Armatimonadota bacterium]